MSSENKVKVTIKVSLSPITGNQNKVFSLVKVSPEFAAVTICSEQSNIGLTKLNIVLVRISVAYNGFVVIFMSEELNWNSSFNNFIDQKISHSKVKSPQEFGQLRNTIQRYY